ncbi:pyruvate, phosphate dikinase [Paramaledivibacter caminithermalis]|jgi:pyruvate,orthophosphate dikinase|uniref:Pyruvate, phosphate dikinase n=1 Tax=Paramaledivibacter caminithermalis (strain DSM 15212 / CIP 107654 / DViRD3) TaxID=1121301 RepID=A0A1M6M812_PARC5|nr:pyruvate, phosphate dikinase [Paramaledivibacter caminithermalis]SHJ79564.1 pyruvate phosphate dikinase [Paramaledivibacter caminithermalis DSM 15212]
MKKYVYFFDEGSKEMKSILGGKGANLAEMSKIGLPVPAGFTITTEACNKYYDDGKKIDDSVKEMIFNNLCKLELKTNKRLGDYNNPLLVSVRSGAVISMPGMMDTVLNLGLNDEATEGLSKITDNPRFAYDSYRRFIQMFGDVVLGIEKYKFDKILDSVKEVNGIEEDIDLTVDNLKEIVKKYKELVKKETRKEFPQDPKEQLMMAVTAVFESWNNARAIVYRNINEIPHHLGTAVNVQSMVFGNLGDTSGTGVAFTRNPSTGEKKIFGEFLINAQGEDVVAGIRTPKAIEELKNIMPEVYEQFIEVTKILERHYKDMQDIEFTIEKGKLYLLQTRTGKRTAKAAINIAVDMVDEGLIDKETAIMRIDPQQIDQLLHPTFKTEELEKGKNIAKGLPASPGASTGKVYFNSEDIIEAAKRGEKTILVRIETSPEDIEGMVNAEGILTTRGGMTSHAAVVARGMGKCCVAGCGEIKVDENNKLFKAGDVVIREGEYISLNGNTGMVYKGIIETQEAQLIGSFAQIMKWSDEVRRLKIRTNADTPKDSETAVKFGAEGIGLCRTEHMFFKDNRILAVREMIIAKTTEDRVKALNKLLPFQEEDFIGIFEAMGSRPVTIRLLDPPLHEFLPHKDEDIKELAEELNMDIKILKETIEDLKEFNPMLGHRGCRLAITYPEIYEMQVRAIISAAIKVINEKGIEVKPEIMIPLIGHEKELEIIKNLVNETAKEVMNDAKTQLNYKVGTMIEIPRAALTADAIAKHAEFFSFGTNDLTQMTFGFSRDDSGKFINEYRQKEIFEKDPFAKLDQSGVGKLIEIAVELGKTERDDIKLGICGEHGGDPESIDFCHRIGLHYVSCSPFRVPIARLAAAQAAIRNK